jgi:hypothetical protein
VDIIHRIGPADPGAAPITPAPAVRRLTREEREAAARERERRRRERSAPRPDDEEPPQGGGHVDVRA